MTPVEPTQRPESGLAGAGAPVEPREGVGGAGRAVRGRIAVDGEVVMVCYSRCLCCGRSTPHEACHACSLKDFTCRHRRTPAAAETCDLSDEECDERIESKRLTIEVKP